MNTRGLTIAELDEVRAALVMFDLDKIASVRVHKQRYCFNQIDIRPTKHAGSHPQAAYMPWWADADFARVQALVQSLNLGSRGCGTDHENARIVFGSGFNYIGKVLS